MVPWEERRERRAEKKDCMKEEKKQRPSES